MLDANTFGNTQCAQNLVSILNELNDKRVTTNVSRFLVHNNRIIHTLSLIKDRNVQNSLIHAYRKEVYQTQIKVPEKVKTHAINILVARLRTEIFRKT